MATVNFIPESNQSISAMKAVIDYCLQHKKVADEDSGRRLVGGVNCDGENSFTEFMVTKNAHKKKGGITFYHYVQSFSPKENVTAEQVHKIGLEFAEKAWPGHEVLVTTHTDAEHLHNHFVINSVHYENGNKLRQNPGTLNRLRTLSDSICNEYGLSVLKPYKKDGANISSREYRAASKGESWKFKLISDIDFVMNRSGSRADFIREMNRLGYQITWTDERKYITFTCPNGMKCRDIRLHDEKYLKGVLEYEFTIRKRLTAEHGGGYAEAEKRADTIRTGADSVSAAGVCNPDRTAQAGEQAVGGCDGVSTKAVSADRQIGDTGRADRPLHRDTEYRSGVYGEDGSGGGEYQRRYSGSDADDRRTGWEESRAIYFELLRNHFGEYQGTGQYDRETAAEDYENNHCHSGIGGSAIGVGLRGVLETGSIIDSTSEDPEERRKRIEAQENASNLGAMIGLAVGAVAAISEADNTEDKTTEETETPTMKM